MAIIVTFFAFTAFGKDLSCRCSDQSTSTIHELNFHFAAEAAASVSLKVTKGPEIKETCEQIGKDFVVSKPKPNSSDYRFSGSLRCDKQKTVQQMAIGFDSATMSLPRDICHKETRYSCEWRS